MKRLNNSQPAQAGKRFKLENNSADESFLQSSPDINRKEPDLRALFRRLCSEESNSPQVKRESSLRVHVPASSNEKEAKVVKESRKIVNADEILVLNKENINVEMDE